MRRNPVDSSNISSIGYDAGSQVLEVEFKSGKVYQYAGVPNDMADQLARADSKGRFFGQHIKGRFTTKEV